MQKRLVKFGLSVSALFRWLPSQQTILLLLLSTPQLLVSPSIDIMGDYANHVAYADTLLLLLTLLCLLLQLDGLKLSLLELKAQKAHKAQNPQKPQIFVR
jgi:hypothetical protein